MHAKLKIVFKICNIVKYVIAILVVKQSCGGGGVQWTILMQCPESLLQPVIYKVKCSSVTLASGKKTPQNYVYFRFPLKHLQPPKQTLQTLHLIHS